MKEKVLAKRRGQESKKAPVVVGQPSAPDRAPPPTSVERWKSQGLSKTHRRQQRPPFDCIILLLQGGGALGAYQGGVYEALAEADLHPDWVAGISIGAINAAIIAGNPPNLRVAKMKEFWHG